jgi:hypothetical protein
VNTQAKISALFARQFNDAQLARLRWHLARSAGKCPDAYLINVARGEPEALPRRPALVNLLDHRRRY